MPITLCQVTKLVGEFSLVAINNVNSIGSVALLSIYVSVSKRRLSSSKISLQECSEKRPVPMSEPYNFESLGKKKDSTKV